MYVVVYRHGASDSEVEIEKKNGKKYKLVDKNTTWLPKLTFMQNE